jgi:2-oxoglutarate ferredoxin oxidoreductase subunit gamma
MTSRTEIRITGFGGQGVVLSGYIIGRACAINANLHATMIQSFGPEARGSACSCTLAISPTEVRYPYIVRPDIFVVMSADGYDKYRDELKDAGTLIYEKDLVHPSLKEGQPAFGVPSTRLAETIVGRTIVQNIVMIGFLGAVTQIVSHDALRDAVEKCVPAGTEMLNLKAFDAGWNYFQEQYGEKAGKTAASAVAATPQAG